MTGRHYGAVTRTEANCALIYDSPDRLFHALWLPDSLDHCMDG